MASTFINGGHMNIRDLKEAIKDLDDDMPVVVYNYLDREDRKVSFLLETDPEDEDDEDPDFVIMQGV